LDPASHHLGLQFQFGLGPNQGVSRLLVPQNLFWGVIRLGSVSRDLPVQNNQSVRIFQYKIFSQ
jgi:hypothetical protein